MACDYRHLNICVALSHLMQDGETALHWACENGHVEVATALLKQGASIDEKDKVRLLHVNIVSVAENGVSGLDTW